MSAALRDARRDRGLRLKDVAAEVGVSMGALSLYERGKATPHPATAVRIAQFFDRPQSAFWPTVPPTTERKAA